MIAVHLQPDIYDILLQREFRSALGVYVLKFKLCPLEHTHSATTILAKRFACIIALTFRTKTTKNKGQLFATPEHNSVTGTHRFRSTPECRVIADTR